MLVGPVNGRWTMLVALNLLPLAVLAGGTADRRGELAEDRPPALDLRQNRHQPARDPHDPAPASFEEQTRVSGRDGVERLHIPDVR